MAYNAKAEAARLIDERTRAYRSGHSIGLLSGDALLADAIRLGNQVGFKSIEHEMELVRRASA